MDSGPGLWPSRNDGDAQKKGAPHARPSAGAGARPRAGVFRREMRAREGVQPRSAQEPSGARLRPGCSGFWPYAARSARGIDARGQTDQSRPRFPEQPELSCSGSGQRRTRFGFWSPSSWSPSSPASSRLRFSKPTRLPALPLRMPVTTKPTAIKPIAIALTVIVTTHAHIRTPAHAPTTPTIAARCTRSLPAFFRLRRRSTMPSSPARYCVRL
jgi:hypothetical protein